MTSRPSALRLLGLGVAALALSSCISLLPKAKPSSLYSFGQTTQTQVGPAPDKQVLIFRSGSLFQRASASDRILTINAAGKAAYVAETRWVSPASVLWDEAVLAAYDADPGVSRLVMRGELAQGADYILRLDVRNFEARYDRGDKAAPLVTVRVRATLTRNKDRELVSDRIFEKQVRAGDNRVSAIVPAYDKAVADTLSEIVAWTNAEAKPVS
jgi:cholesterol transport system auxiliary component